jgi:cell wall-associated NlpC family hydrolase
VSLVGEDLIIDGEKLDPDISQQIMSVTLIRTMDGAESLEIEVADPNMDLLVSGALTKKGRAPTKQQKLVQAAWDRFATARLTLDGIFFRLAGASGNYAAPPWSVTLTFESEVATFMRLADKPIKWRRGHTTAGIGTRAGFIRELAWKSQPGSFGLNPRLVVHIPPGTDTTDPVAKPKEPNRSKGLHKNANLTIEGDPIDAEQRRQLSIALTEADAQGATERVTLAMLVAGIGESNFRPIMNSGGSGYGGVFQGDVSAHYHYFKVTDTKLEARYFLKGGKGYQGGGAISLAAKNADMTPGTIAYTVEGDRSNFSSDQAAETFYQQHLTEAQKILDAWGGATRTFSHPERFEYRAGMKDPTTGKRENYWDASGRLVDERNWRRMATRNALWVGPDSWFITWQPAFLVTGKPQHGESRMARLSSQGVLSLSFQADIGMPVAEIVLTVLTPRWTVGPAEVFELDDLGPLTGRWLIWENRAVITDTVETATLTLRRPAPQKREPAPTIVTRTEETPDAGTARDEIIKQARKALAKSSHYSYLQIRPMPRSLFAFPQISLPTGGTTNGVLKIDCSAFVTLVYKAAGIKDPNALGYNGQGYTDTLAANATKTGSPQVGDFAFYGSGPPFEHVAIYSGNGKVIQMGLSSVRELPVRDVRSDFYGYYTTDLSPAS